MFPSLGHHHYYAKLKQQGLLQKAAFNLSDACAEATDLGTLIAWANTHDAFKQHLEKPLTYAPIAGSLSMRQAISEFHGQQSPHQYLTFNGAQEALYCALGAILEPADEVISFTPAYPTLNTTPKLFGANIKTITLFNGVKKNEALNLSEEIQAHISKKTKAIIVNQPHNPTGFVFSEKHIDQIHALANTYGLYLVADEVSLATDFGTSTPSFYRAGAKVISIGVCAKSLGLSGIRIGWAICENEHVRNKMQTIKTHLGVCTSAMDEILLTAALAQTPHIIKRNQTILLKNKALFEAFIKTQPKLKWYPPTAGLVSLVELDSKYPIEAFAKELIENEKLLILPGQTLGVTGNFFRLGLGKSNFQQGLNHLEHGLRKRV